MADEFPYAEYFPEECPFYRTTSPFAESPLSTNATQTQEIFFGSADSYSVNGVDIIYENNVSPGIIDELYEFQESNMSSLYEEDESPASPYVVKVFVSKDDSYLRQAFDKTKPLSNEICLFLEDNSTDYVSGGSAYVKIGDDFRDDLAQRKEIAQSVSENMEYFRFVNDNNETDLSINFTEEQIEELIATGEISNTSRSIIIGVFQALTYGTYILSPVYKFVGDGLTTITDLLRDTIKFSDEQWDPEAVPQGTRFEPFFFPVGNEITDLELWATETAADEVSEVLLKQLEIWKSGFKSSWNAYSRFTGAYTVPAGITSFLNKCETRIIQLIEQQNANVKTMAGIFIPIGEKFVNAVNAFYCGLWNALVEAVLGMVDMVAFIFKALALSGEAVGNAQKLVPQALELIDEFIQAIMQADFPDLLSAAFTAIQNQLASINFTTLVGSISVERTAYFLGAVIGFIVEIVAGILYSGGLEALTSTLRKFGKIGTDILELMTSKTAKAFGTAVAFSLDSMIAIAQKMIELLKKGKTEVTAFINDVFEIIKKGAKLTDEVIAEIMRKFGFTNPEKQLIDELGLAFVNYSGDACSICQQKL